MDPMWMSSLPIATRLKMEKFGPANPSSFGPPSKTRSQNNLTGVSVIGPGLRSFLQARLPSAKASGRYQSNCLMPSSSVLSISRLWKAAREEKEQGTQQYVFDR